MGQSMSLSIPIRVLIVARDPLFCYLLQRVVHQLGHVVLETSTGGSTVLGMVVALEPDVILMDVYLPERDGFEVTQHLREFCAIPVVLITDEAETLELASKVQQAGAEAYLVQPFSSNEVQQAIVKVLNLTNGKTPQAE